MTEKDHVQYLYMALSQLGISTDVLVVEMIIKTEDILREKGGKFDLKDLASIKAEMCKRSNELKEDEESFQALLEKTMTSRTRNAIKQYFSDINMKHPKKADFKRIDFKRFALVRGVGKKSAKELEEFVKDNISW